MKTITFRLLISFLALLTSIGAMAIEITIENHVTGNLAAEINDRLGENSLTDVTALIISGANINFDNDATAITSCTNLLTLDVSGITFTNNTLSSKSDGTAGMCTGLTKLTTVVLPDNLTSLGNAAFRGCTSLETINLNNNITTIGQYSFYGCRNLQITSLPPNLVTIGGNSFYQSTVTLSSLPETVETIGASAFYKCPNVTLAKLPDALKTIGAAAFEEVPITISELPAGVTALSNRVFIRTGIVDFTLPETLVSIGQLAFFADNNPSRIFTCRKATLPTLPSVDRPFGTVASCSNTVIHILKKVPDADIQKYENTGVTIDYLTQNITVNITGSGTVSVSGNAVETAGPVVDEDVVEAYEAESITFTFTPDEGYQALAAFDNGSLRPINELTLQEVSQNGHTLQVVFTNASVWSPTGESTNWHDPVNWTTNSVPNVTSNVIIPKSDFYPVLLNTADCDNILFEFGAEIGKQHLLTANNAEVNCKLDKDRWYLFSMPLNNVSTNNFYFGGAPVSHIKVFESVPYNEDYYANWKDLPNRSTPFQAGEAFAFGLSGNVNKGTAHEFVISGEFINNNGTVEETLLFGKDDTYGTNPFALAGNPYMATIDFHALAGDESIISKNYLLINGDRSIVGYTPNGLHGAIESNRDIDNDELTQYIAPFQSFIVEKSDNNISGINSLTFSPDIQVTNESSGFGLKATGNPDYKLNIIADNGIGSVLTFIAKRENGQSARKLMTNGNFPDIYTLNGFTAFGAQLINTDDISIPLGISTSYSGEMTLTFSGMDSFSNVDIKLIDNEAIEGNKETKLTGDAYIYTFTHTPKSNSVPTEDRFFIAFSPTDISGISEANEEKIDIYGKNDMIYVVASSQNLIRQILVYDIQGRLIHLNENVGASDYLINNLSENPTGIYVVKVITEKSVRNVKIMNKR